VYNHFIIYNLHILKAHPKVAQRLKYMVKKWAEMKEFKDDPSLK
jgi:hypothetical protein